MQVYDLWLGSWKNEEPGAQGEDGKSAYQVWLDAGNVGTEQDFLDSLVGADGAQGDQGIQGPQGEPGESNEVTAESADAALNELVYLADDNGTLKCYRAGNDSQFADGVIKALDNGQATVVLIPLLVNIASGLADDTPLYLGTAGAYTETPPSAAGKKLQPVGRVVDNAHVLINIKPGRTIV